MSPPIRSFHPDIRITVWRRNPENLFEKVALDISDALGDTGSCMISKNLYSPCGEFTLLLPDIPQPRYYDTIGRRDSLYGLINPLDPIQIELRRNNNELMPQDWTVVLRGVIRSVGRNESVGGDGRVQRNVMVSGHDLGCLFLMQQIRSFISVVKTGMSMPTSLANLLMFGLTPNPRPIAEVVWDIATHTTSDLIANAGWQWVRSFSQVEGWFQPSAVLAAEGPVWSLLNRLSDSPWNEFFVREGPTQPELVFRETPWRTLDGQWIAGEVDVVTWEIPMAAVVSLTAHRDDADVVNYIWVDAQVFPQAANTRPLLNNWPQPDQRYAPPEIAGYRMQSIQSSIGAEPPINNLPEKPQIEADKTHADWVLDRATWLVKATQEALRLESGSVTIKGDPNIRVGDYIQIPRGEVVWTGYVTGVRNSYQGFKNYMTTINYIRGTQYVQRLANDRPWETERRTI